MSNFYFMKLRNSKINIIHVIGIEKASAYNWIFSVTYKFKTCFKHTQTNVPQNLND